MAKILVIDDDMHMRKVVRHMLEQKEHDVIVTEDGVQGVKAYLEDRFDLVITDIVMPEKEGLETIQEIKKVNPHCKIIAISGGGFNGPPKMYLKLAEKFGAMQTIEKPFSWKQLTDTVNFVLSA